MSINPQQARALQALKNGGLLAVHGQYFAFILANCLVEQRLPADDAFLVCQSNSFACLERSNQRRERGKPADAVDDYVRLRHGGESIHCAVAKEHFRIRRKPGYI